MADPDLNSVEYLRSRLEHHQYWYGVRYRVLFDWAHSDLNEEQRTRFFSIIANGTPSAMDPPTYAQQFNMMKHRMEKAEAELVELRECLSGAAPP